MTLEEFEALVEAAYERMYDARSQTSAAGCYGEAKDAFASAIGIARLQGRFDDLQRLTARLEHVKAVFRSQFSN
jgi:hypothetical protein